MAQLVRAPPCHGGGHWFESRLGRFSNLFIRGVLAQLGEHLPYKQRVIGSSPIGPTFLKKIILCRSGGTGRRPGLKIPWVAIPVPVRSRSAAEKKLVLYKLFLYYRTEQKTEVHSVIKKTICLCQEGLLMKQSSVVLEQHIIDTVKEWQIKIGYRREAMNLYYPEESLKDMLGLSENASEEELKKALELFSEETNARFGQLKITGKDGRYCIGIPEAGCEYIHTTVPDSEFLKSFLKVVTGLHPDFEQVRMCFKEVGDKYQEAFAEQDHGTDGMGRVFYFTGKDRCGTPETSRIDCYVYCVELDDFGMTYHRFSWHDYQKLLAADHS